MATARSRELGPQACFEKALQLLSRRPHFRRELERKLLMREFEREDVVAALDRAAEKGFLDDLECARELARVRVERRQEGPAKVLATLTRRGSDSETARQVVGEWFAGGEDEAMKAAASKWLRRHEWDADRLARHLSRKGYSKGAILANLSELRPEGSRSHGSERGR